MKKISLIIGGMLLLGILSGCSDVETISEKSDKIRNTEAQFSDYTKSLQKVVVTYNQDSAFNADATEEDKKKATEIGKSLLPQSEKILAASSVPDIQQLNDDEKIVAAMLPYAEYMDQKAY